MWYILAIENCSALKRREILTHAATGISLEDIMLNEVIQTQNTDTV